MRRLNLNHKKMNTLKRLLLVIALTAFGTTLGLLAEPAAPAENTKEHTEKPEKAKRVSRVDKLANALSLSVEQKASVAAILKEENAALKVVSEDKSLERATKIARNKEIRTAHAAKLRALLTPEQQTTFDALQAKHTDKADDEKSHDEKH
jgi:Spy/CpxP family protein refolding chaperone